MKLNKKKLLQKRVDVIVSNKQIYFQWTILLPKEKIKPLIIINVLIIIFILISLILFYNYKYITIIFNA